MTLVSKDEAEKYLEPNNMIIAYNSNDVAQSWWLKENNGVRYSVDFTGKIQVTSSQGATKHHVRSELWIEVPDSEDEK